MSESKEATKDTTSDHGGGFSAPPQVDYELQNKKDVQELAEWLGTAAPRSLRLAMMDLMLEDKREKLRIKKIMEDLVKVRGTVPPGYEE